MATIPGMPRRGWLRAWMRLGLIAAVILGVVTGLVVVVLGLLTNNFHDHHSATPHPSSPGPVRRSSGGQGPQAAQEDELAARPMLALPLSAAQPQPLTTASAGAPIAVPPPSDPSGQHSGAPVATGYAHNPEGALGQLAAIDEAGLTAVDPGELAQLYRWAAAPGAVPLAGWNLSDEVHDLLKNANGPGSVQASYRVSEGQIKGTVGTDWAVVCVLGELDVTITSSVRAGLGDCQRMNWIGDRWQIGPGAQPAPAPSAWPGCPAAVRAGWRELDRG